MMKTNTAEIAEQAALAAVADLELKEGVTLTIAEVASLTARLQSVIQHGLWSTRWWKRRCRNTPFIESSVVQT